MIARLFDVRTIVTMGSAFGVAVFFLLPFVQQHLLLYVLYRGLCVGDILFHELGHAITSWLFGAPAIPSIMTAIGADKAGGYTLWWDKSWVVQIAVWVGLAFGCLWLRANRPAVFLPAVVLLVVLMGVSFTRYPEMIRDYMGHGGAILAGGVLLYRAWLDIIVRTAWERWLNALFGFFIVMNNGLFSYQLRFSPGFQAQYGDLEITGDFIKVADFMPHWRVEGVALFTLVYAVMTLLLSYALAAYFYEDEHCAD